MGTDDIFLTKLDEIFDSPFLDNELFGIDLENHCLFMSLIGGLLSFPFFIIVNYVSLSPQDYCITSILGIVESQTNFNYYESMFNSSW